MHIMEGFLPHPWWEIWFVASIPIVAYGIYQISGVAKKHPEAKPLLALVGAFIFVLSALKLPSVTGSCSHPTGSGLAAVLFGPAIASVLSMIALVFQALLLAHGGLTTLGANTLSMGIVGPVVAFAIWVVCKKTNVPNSVGVFLAVAFGDLLTYVTTSAQLALAFPTAAGFFDAFVKFGTVFAITQIPLAIAEGILAIFLFDFLVKYRGQLLSAMGVIKLPIIAHEQEGKK
ncbi:MAG: energy-coupling factor ABC transporter permease [archaeon]|nr:energy-coupling factor ABC transporter permease [archaeon]